MVIDLKLGNAGSPRSRNGKRSKYMRKTKVRETVWRRGRDHLPKVNAHRPENGGVK